MKYSKKKKILIGAISFIFILAIALGIYACIHHAANNKFLDKYTANGFKKNVFDDYTCTESGCLFSVYKAYFSHNYSNISVTDSEGIVTLITWVNIYNDEKTYGLIVNDMENEITYEIPIDDMLIPRDKEDEIIVQKFQDEIHSLIDIAQEKWDLDLCWG